MLSFYIVLHHSVVSKLRWIPSKRSFSRRNSTLFIAHCFVPLWYHSTCVVLCPPTLRFHERTSAPRTPGNGTTLCTYLAHHNISIVSDENTSSIHPHASVKAITIFDLIAFRFPFSFALKLIQWFRPNHHPLLSASLPSFLQHSLRRIS